MYGLRRQAVNRKQAHRQMQMREVNGATGEGHRLGQVWIEYLDQVAEDLDKKGPGSGCRRLE